MRGRINIKVTAGIAITAAVSVALYFWGKQIPQETIKNFLQATGPLAPVTFIAVYITNIVIAPINGIPFLIAAFYIFGGLPTVIYVYFASIIGYTINFFIAKKWGRPVVAKLAGHDAIAKIDELEKDYGVGTLVLMRIFLIGFGDFISYGYGLTPIKTSTYLAITYIAIIPSHIAWYFFAAHATGIEQFVGVNIAVTWILTGLFVFGTYIYRRTKSGAKGRK
ncbi:MAG TPA: VTT domain-containing protein [Candidatus Saccharimonadales bacterium]|nr:VTT domain-containing protein [Candidatus Saccharimonadales bacterium]